MRRKAHTSVLTLLLVAAAPWATAAAVAAPGSAPGGGRPGDVDLDLHRPPPSKVKTPPPTPAGAMLTPPTTAANPYHLRPAPDGGYLYQGPAFNAHILADGVVEFSSRDLSVALDPEGRGHQPNDHDPVTATEPVTATDPVSVGGGPALHFDATNEYLRRLGKDPARDAKAAFLTGTFDLRMKMAFDARSNVRRAALADLPNRLDELWRDPGLTRSERRHLLRAIWDEIGTGANNARTRAIVRDFARRHLPPKEAATFR